MTVRSCTSFHFDYFFLNGKWEKSVRVAIDHGQVYTVSIGSSAAAGDTKLGIGMPGMYNVHSHAFQRGLAGLTETRGSNEDSFWTWRELMYRFVEKMTPAHLEDIAALAYVEMLESGFTRVGEFHYIHHDRGARAFSNPAEMSLAIISAAGRSGIGLTHLPVFYAHADFGGRAPETHQRRFVHSLDSFARLLDETRRPIESLPDGVLGIAPHSLRAVTPNELEAIARLAGNSPVHIHIAEQAKEVEACLEWAGARPVEWLLSHAAINHSWCLVHATQVTTEEIAGIARAGAVVGLCPITEANLGDGVFPAAQLMNCNGSFGIGSDSNVLIDMTEEFRLLEYSQRFTAKSRNVLADGPGRSTGASLYVAALKGGAQALGQPAAFAEGASADFVTLNLSHPTLVGRGPSFLLDSLIFGTGRAGLDGVWRRGEQVVSEGSHKDRQHIEERYRKALVSLLS